jgi:hypothetical protein
MHGGGRGTRHHDARGAAAEFVAGVGHEAVPMRFDNVRSVNSFIGE